MTLAPGTRIGPYEIVAPLGAGGMGEVHRARDARLGRDVAIKALPETLAHDAERVARFEREARLLASLNHPNIGAIHGLEEAGGHRYLVLEFVDGETLAQRLRRGALPVREALTVCRAIAGALEAAHESGVIHRDLKPGNVMVRGDGEVKVLDFGLAKGGAANAGSDAGLSASPTMTYAATGVGMVLGTAAYMSPEQARGKTVDRRTDIWSFGCVLYECLTGRQVFEGETVSDVIARILEREPDWNALPPALAPAVRELLQRCLDKDAKQRLRDIGDARLVLEKELAGGSGAVRAAVAAPERPGVGLGAIVAAIVAGLLAGAALGALLAPRLLPGPASTGFSHVSVAFPDDPRIEAVNISPDGRTLLLYGRPSAESGAGSGRPRIYVRRLDGFELRELPGTEGVDDFHVTPDSRAVVIRVPLGPGTSERRLARVPLDGSVPPVTISRWDPAWNSFSVLSTGEIVILDNEGRRLFRMSAAGGPAREVALDRADVRAHMRLAEPLPGDRGIFVTAGVYRDRGWAREVGIVDLEKNRLVFLDLPGGEATCLADGTLLFSRGQVLLAAPFDLGRLTLRGAPVPVATGLRATFANTPGLFMVTPDGTLLYPPGGEVGNNRTLGIVDREGRLRPLAVDAHAYQGWPSVARDDRTFAVRILNANGIDEIWVGEREHASLRRLVAWPEADCVSAILSGDGRTVSYTRVGRDSLDGVYLSDVGEGGTGRRILAPEKGEAPIRAECWSPDGSWLLATRETAEGTTDLWRARLNASRDSVLSFAPWLRGPGRKEASIFSPDGRWVAYENDESGRDEVYVAPFGADGSAGRPTRITRDGGDVPEWFDGGRKLAIRQQDSRLVWVLELALSPVPAVLGTKEWFDFGETRALDGWTLQDGSMMVILRGTNETDGYAAVNLVAGWTRDLKRRMAAAR